MARRKLLLALVALAATLGGCGGGGTETSGTDERTTNSPSRTEQTVAIENFEFMPAELKIEQGTTVRWTNRDRVFHTVTAEERAAVSFDSGQLRDGATFEHTFAEKGSFAYKCTIHPSMTATVVVS